MENITLLIVRSSDSKNGGSGNPGEAKPKNNISTSRPTKGILAGMTFPPKVKAAALEVTPHIQTTPTTSSVSTQNIKEGERKPSLRVTFLGAGLAACMAEVVTFPLDTAKVRLQIQGEGAGLSAATSNAIKGQAVAKKLEFQGVVGTLSTLARKEGPRAWYQGLTAGLQRQMCFASVRIGLYDVIKQKYCRLFNTPETNTNFHIRILAGITSGALAIMCFQPTDVVKTRLQAQTSGNKRYTGALHAYRTIATQEGIKGLWKGLAPNVARNCIVNVSELVTYDVFKEYLLSHRIMPDNMPCHFVSAAGAGLVTTLLASPVDVVKTRFMNSTPGQYRHAVHCALLMAKSEGPKAFYKGCLPSFLRLTSWSIVMFVSYEQIKRAFSSDLKMDQSPYFTLEDVMPMVDRLPLLEEVLDTSGPSRFI